MRTLKYILGVYVFVIGFTLGLVGFILTLGRGFGYYSLRDFFFDIIELFPRRYKLV